MRCSQRDPVQATLLQFCGTIASPARSQHDGSRTRARAAARSELSRPRADAPRRAPRRDAHLRVGRRRLAGGGGAAAARGGGARGDAAEARARRAARVRRRGAELRRRDDCGHRRERPARVRGRERAARARRVRALHHPVVRARGLRAPELRGRRRELGGHHRGAVDPAGHVPGRPALRLARDVRRARGRRARGHVRRGLRGDDALRPEPGRRRAGRAAPAAPRDARRGPAGPRRGRRGARRRRQRRLLRDILRGHVGDGGQ